MADFQDIPAARRAQGAGARPTMAARFGGAGGPVDYTDRPAHDDEILPLPSPDDSFEVLVDKLERLAKVVRDNKSLALYTGFHATPGGAINPVDVAKRQFTTKEREQYAEWEAGSELPPFDWNRDRLPVAGKDGNPATLSKWAEALSILWDTKGADNGNVVWFKKSHPYLIPLVTAMVGVINARKGLTSGQAALSEMEMAEYQTARKIAAEATDNIRITMEAMRRPTERMSAHIQVIQERSRQLGNKIPGKDRGDGPFNKERIALGKRRVGVDFEVTHNRGAGREVRTRHDIQQALAMPQRPVASTSTTAPRAPPAPPTGSGSGTGAPGGFARWGFGGSTGGFGSSLSQPAPPEAPPAGAQSPTYRPASPPPPSDVPMAPGH
ncbi:hypothetical protein [Sclerotium hydrophilum virus 1]|uniref:Uncharacterized protein n=1 Tax=Sclerotium hydrophilum virus 1 TaxID=1895000 RepID=A0A1B3SH25_9VIRU|nr:hypothetical protein BHT40_s2gp1 [Sclerotium hydrophilum virus 1]AOG59237.1 hypothetical protein [Sclerotium hydrophilum virus 1]